MKITKTVMLAGKLWQATATVQAVRGTVTPIIPDPNACSNNSQNYQVLWQAFTPNGMSGATIAQGTKSSGKIYFDVTGRAPARVVYNNGVQDLLIWEKIKATTTSAVVVVKGLAAGTPRLVSGWLDRVPRASGRYLGR